MTRQSSLVASEQQQHEQHRQKQPLYGTTTRSFTCSSLSCRSKMLHMMTVLFLLTLQLVSAQVNTTTPTFAPSLASTNSTTIATTTTPTSSPSATATIATPVTTTPTTTPTVTMTMSPTFTACSVCPVPNHLVTNNDALYNDRTCLEWQVQGQSGQLSPDECQALRDSVSFQAVCDCAAPPTLAPTTTPTLPPTQAPTAPLRTFTIPVVLMLQNVTTAMSPVHANYFGPQLAAFLEQVLQPQTALGRGWTGKVEAQLLLQRMPNNPNNNNNNIRRRRRDLQSITVSAPLATRTMITATQPSDLEPLPQDTVQFYVEDILQSRGQEFLPFLLAQTESPTLEVYFEKIKTVTVFPAQDTNFDDLPARAPPGVEGLDDDTDDDDDDELLSMWAIIGIAGGVGVCLLCIALVMLGVMQPETMLNSSRVRGRNNHHLAAVSSHDDGAGGGGFSTSPTKNASSTKNNGSTRAGITATHSQEDDTTYYGNASILNPPTVTPHDADNQSYAYSLEPATFDTATVGGGGQSFKASASQKAAPGAAVPGVPSSRTEDADTKTSSRRGPMVTRQINAPPGKLGIVIDTSLEGPIVHKVNENSPLLGKIFQGDIITSINGIDTRAMKASAITTIMVRTAHEPRKLTVASEDTTTQMR